MQIQVRENKGKKMQVKKKNASSVYFFFFIFSNKDYILYAAKRKTVASTYLYLQNQS